MARKGQKWEMTQSRRDDTPQIMKSFQREEKGQEMRMLESICMKCPHCTVAFHDEPKGTYIGKDAEAEWAVIKRVCPSCHKIILHLRGGQERLQNGASFINFRIVRTEILVRPRGSSRAPCPAEVPPKFADDYSESCVVLPDSAKAAAALGRRCLQNLLREVAKVKPATLAAEIQEVIDSGKLPSDLNDSIDAIRNIGNFAAHPVKSQHTGE